MVRRRRLGHAADLLVAHSALLLARHAWLRRLRPLPRRLGRIRGGGARDSDRGGGCARCVAPARGLALAHEAVHALRRLRALPLSLHLLPHRALGVFEALHLERLRGVRGARRRLFCPLLRLLIHHAHVLLGVVLGREPLPPQRLPLVGHWVQQRVHGAASMLPRRSARHVALPTLTARRPASSPSAARPTPSQRMRPRPRFSLHARFSFSPY
mmetsp:Transcript_70747/g.167831  ORF Transcript_70747/g.167831 Transcript_70747/m.167831 type:complete len:213 (-) Transcript_70747:52-690(-)